MMWPFWNEIVASSHSRVKKAMQRIVSLWVEAEAMMLKSTFHRSSPLPCEGSDRFGASVVSRGFEGFSA